MSDIPKVPAAALQAAMRETLHASRAVKQGIATHAEKHAAQRHAAHAKLEADRKLQESTQK